MNRLHVHLSVKDLQNSINFYRELFGAEPDKIKPDYAKWNLTNRPLNFAISNKGNAGVNHQDIEAENSSEPDKLYQRFTPIEGIKDNKGETVYCHIHCIKIWFEDSKDIDRKLFCSLNDEDQSRDE